MNTPLTVSTDGSADSTSAAPTSLCGGTQTLTVVRNFADQQGPRALHVAWHHAVGCFFPTIIWTTGTTFTPGHAPNGATAGFKDVRTNVGNPSGFTSGMDGPKGVWSFWYTDTYVAPIGLRFRTGGGCIASPTGNSANCTGAFPVPLL